MTVSAAVVTGVLHVLTLLLIGLAFATTVGFTAAAFLQADRRAAASHRA
ncbi:hypothetical protein [Streptomyces sp. NPDC051577]